MSAMPSESLIDFVENYAAHGNEVAVRQRRGYRMESWTYGQIAENAKRLARELEIRGIKQRDAVLLWGRNSAEWIVVFLGCLLHGVVIVPIDRASSGEFARRIAREVNAKLLFCSRGQNGAVGIPSVSLESVCSLISKHDPFPHSSSLSRQDALQIIFTSGATAEPCGVIISHGNVLANIEPLQREIQNYSRYERFVHPLRFLNLLPLSHVYGQMLGIFIPAMLAGTVVFLDSVTPADLMESIHHERVSVLVAVPRFLESLQREIERRQERDGSVERFWRNFALSEDDHFLKRWWRFRRIHSQLGWKFWALISGGAALQDAAETFWNRLGFAVIQGYGMTETTSLISLNHPFRSAHGSIGKVFPGVEVRVDENGEILVRGKNVASAYLQNGAIRTIPESDGWFRTGDMAERDETGRLFFKGRRKNIIVTSAGMNVYPEDLEKALRAQPGVRDCVVIGLEKDGNAEPCAVLLMNGSNRDSAAVTKGANQSLAEYQKIRRWFLWPEPDFPRTTTQKPILPRIREAVENAATESTQTTSCQHSLASLLSHITGRSVQLTSKDANLETDVGLTSLDRAALLGVLQEQHQAGLDEGQFQGVVTVAQLEKLLSEGTSSTARHVYPNWPQHWLTTAIRAVIYHVFAWPTTYLLAAPCIRGCRNLRGLRGPVLVVSNHVTYADITWILAALPARFRNHLAVAMGGERLARMRRPSDRQNLFERVLERVRYVLVLSLFNVFPLPQQSGFLTSFRFAGSLVDRGWSILVFPEGETTKNGQILPFRPGIGLLAKRLSIPVVPIHLQGPFDLKLQRRIAARPGHVRVTIGAPMRFASDQHANEIARQLELRVRDLQSL